MRRRHVNIVGGLTLLATSCHVALDGSRYLWYTAPGVVSQWEIGSLPIGNGRMGATFLGGTTETITLTEDTIWNGPLQDRTPPEGLEAFPIVRDMLIAGNMSDASDLILQKMGSTTMVGMRAFSYFGNLNLAFGHANMENYTRWLDTRTGHGGVEYSDGGVDFKSVSSSTKYSSSLSTDLLTRREYVASNPDGIIAARIVASQPGSLSLNATFTRRELIVSNNASTSESVHEITMKGKSVQPMDQNPILFTGKARFVAPGGEPFPIAYILIL